MGGKYPWILAVKPVFFQNNQHGFLDGRVQASGGFLIDGWFPGLKVKPKRFSMSGRECLAYGANTSDVVFAAAASFAGWPIMLSGRYSPLAHNGI